MRECDYMRSLEQGKGSEGREEEQASDREEEKESENMAVGHRADGEQLERRVSERERGQARVDHSQTNDHLIFSVGDLLATRSACTSLTRTASTCSY